MADCMDELLKDGNGFHVGDEELDHGSASPIGSWEIVGSRPGSPTTENMLDAAVLEDAIASRALQGNHVSRRENSFENETLPLSLVLSDGDSEGVSRSSYGISALGFSLSPKEESEAVAYTYAASPSATLSPSRDLYKSAEGLMHEVAYTTITDDAQNTGVTCYIGKYDGTLHAENSDYGDDYENVDESMHCLNSSIEARSYFPTETTTYVWRNNGELRSPSSISAESVENMCDQQISLVRPKERGSISSSAGTDTNKISEGEHSDEASGDVSSHPVREDESLLNAGRYVLNSLSNSYYTVLARSFWLWSRLSARQEQFGRANTIWSLALTSLTMGIVFLGRSWKHLQLQNRSFRAELLAKEKRIAQLLYELMIARNTFLKARRVPIIHVKPTSLAR